MSVTLQGLDTVMANLNEAIRDIENRSMKGLIEGAIIIRRDMDKTSPRIPVDTGNLRSSWFTTPFYVGNYPALLMGFTANYALYVHEMIGPINWNRKGSGPKFLEASLKRNIKEVLEAIRTNVQIPR
jgi:hypothetical protein